MYECEKVRREYGRQKDKEVCGRYALEKIWDRLTCILVFVFDYL